MAGRLLSIRAEMDDFMTLRYHKIYTNVTTCALYPFSRFFDLKKVYFLHSIEIKYPNRYNEQHIQAAGFQRKGVKISHCPATVTVETARKGTKPSHCLKTAGRRVSLMT